MLRNPLSALRGRGTPVIGHTTTEMDRGDMMGRTGRDSSEGGFALRWLGAAALIAFCLLASLLLPGGATPASGWADRTANSDRFPLWATVPTKAFAVLDEGKNRQQFQWGAYVYRDKGSNVGAEPCLIAAAFYDGPPLPGGGLYQPGEPACGPLAPSASDLVTARTGVVVKRYPKAPTATAAVIAMSFSSNVYRVEIEVSPGPDLRLRTKLLSAAQAAKAKVDQFRFTAFHLLRQGKRACITRVKGFDRQGIQLFEDTHRACD